MGDERGGWRKEKKEGENAISLGLGLSQQIKVKSGPSWARIGPRLKEMGLGGAMGGMGSGCLQLRFRTLFDVLALFFSTNVGSMQGQFLQKIDLNTFPSIYGTFSRSKPKIYGEFFNQHFLQCLGSPTFA